MAWCCLHLLTVWAEIRHHRLSRRIWGSSSGARCVSSSYLWNAYNAKGPACVAADFQPPFTWRSSHSQKLQFTVLWFPWNTSSFPSLIPSCLCLLQHLTPAWLQPLWSCSVNLRFLTGSWVCLIGFEPDMCFWLFLVYFFTLFIIDQRMHVKAWTSYSDLTRLYKFYKIKVIYF